jgi:uncharacterized protein (DUF488 family)
MGEPPEAGRRLYTVGHGTLSEAAFSALATGAGVREIVDVRSFPGSRHSPQFGIAELGRWLPEHDLRYRWMRDLGGRRKPVSPSRHVGLRHPAFRAYADHMDTPTFIAAVAMLAAGPDGMAVMCSESVWWRCHRRLLADHLTLIEGLEVIHLMHDGRRMLHALTDTVWRDGGHLTYDLPAGSKLARTSRPSAG